MVEHDNHLRHQSLFRAVILQAVTDAKSRSNKREKLTYKHEAEHWLFSDRKDFAMVCELAGWHPDQVRRKAMDARARGFFWKNAPEQAIKVSTQPQKRGRKRAQVQMVLPFKVRPHPAPPKKPRCRRVLTSNFVQLQLAL
jgi:hypothetical protein